MPEGAQWHSASSSSDDSIRVAEDDFKPSQYSGGGWNTHSEGGNPSDNMFYENQINESDIIDTVTGSNESDVIFVPLRGAPYIIVPDFGNADADKDGLIDIYIPHTYKMDNGKSHTFYTHIDNFNINEDDLSTVGMLGGMQAFDNTTNGIIVGHEIMNY